MMKRFLLILPLNSLILAGCSGQDSTEISTQPRNVMVDVLEDGSVIQIKSLPA